MVFPAGLLVAAALVLGFLAVIAFLGWLAYRGLRNPRGDGQGSTGSNVALGCVLAALGLFALLFLGGISALFLFRSSTAQAVAEHQAARDAQRHAEAARAEEHDEEHAEAEAGREVDEMVHFGGSQHVRLRFELRGPTGAVEEDMVEKLRELACDETGVIWTIEVVPSNFNTDPKPYRTLELGGRIDPDAIDEVEDRIRAALSQLVLPPDQSIEYKDTVLDH